MTELLTRAWADRERGGGDERDMALAGVDLILDGIEARLAQLTAARKGASHDR